MMVLRGPGALLICFHTWIAVHEISACQFGPNCIYPCHCLNNAPCDPITGECPDGACDDGNPHDNWWTGDWFGPACQIGNAAYNKPAEQWDMDQGDNVASRAVDGNWNQDISGGHCSHATGGAPSWWQVDLGQQHVILNLTIYNRWDCCGNRLASTSIEVSNTSLPDSYQECEYIHNGDRRKVPEICYSPVIGRYLRLRRSESASEANNINICEVYISAYIFRECETSSFGAGCVTSCNCDVRCDLISGDCPGTCTPGWVGEDCQQPCTDGAWGHRCSKICNCLDSAEVCDHVSGRCSLSGCATHYVGIGCDAEFPPYDYELIVLSTSATSVEVSFITWSEDTGSGVPPAGYVLKWRQVSGVTWVEAARMPEERQSYNVTYMFEDLDPCTQYMFMVCPYIVLEDAQYEGNGSYIIQQTLPLEIEDEEDYVVATVVSCVFIILLVISVVVTYRCRRQVEDCTKRVRDAGGTTYDSRGNDARTDDFADVYEDIQTPSHVITTECMAQYVEDKARMMSDLKGEFKKLPFGQTAKWDVGQKASNQTKNVFPGIIAYDHSRVELIDNVSHGRSKYINASHIPCCNEGDTGYIAAQGPVVSTVEDWWSMIWQKDVNRVVTMGNPVQGDNVIYEAFWPVDKTITNRFGDYTVELVKCQDYTDFMIRKLAVLYKGERRTFTQFHFTSWPNKGVPEMGTPLLVFRKKVRSQDTIASGPVMVHCSAGIGATAVFIAIDSQLSQAEAEGHIDVLQCVSLMRSARVNMVPNLDQYVFIYKTLLGTLLTGETAIAASRLDDEYHARKLVNPGTQESAMDTEFKNLNYAASDSNKQNQDGLLEDNQLKNCSLLIIPDDRYRPLLTTPVPGTNDYINAVFVDGYRSPRIYVVTQRPLPHTIPDFWRLVYDYKCRTCILLDTMGKEELVRPVFWPDNESLMEFGPLGIKRESAEFITDDILVREFTVEHKGEKASLHVKQFVLQDWSENQDTPPDVHSMLRLMELADRWQQENGNQPAVVQCKNGAHHSGVFCAASYMVEKLKLDREVDVFHSVARVRDFRPQFIVSQEQYEFLYKIAMAFIRSYAEYANFK